MNHFDPAFDPVPEYPPGDPRQIQLFDVPKARRTDPETSHEAARSMRTEAHSQRERIYQFLLANGPQTADALDKVLGLRPTSAGRRLPELHRHARVRRLAETELTCSGRSAHLWEAIL